MALPSGTDVVTVSQNSSGGTVMGDSATALIGFYGVTSPVAQASAITSPATTAATTSTPWGYSTSTQADALVTAVNSILTALRNLNLIAT